MTTVVRFCGLADEPVPEMTASTIRNSPTPIGMMAFSSRCLRNEMLMESVVVLCSRTVRLPDSCLSRFMNSVTDFPRESESSSVVH